MGLAALLVAAELVTFPSAQCAALWLGYGAVSRAVDTDRVEGFRAVAHRLNPGRARAVDDWIVDEARQMALLAEQAVLEGDRFQRRTFEDLLETCRRDALRHPETAVTERP